MNQALILHQLKHANGMTYHHCAICEKFPSYDSKLYHCKNCKQAIYCSKNCQIKDWDQHKFLCQQNTSVSQIGDGILADESEDKTEIVIFGSLPRGVIETISRFLPKKDILNFRLVAKYILSNPGVLRNLQNNYIYVIKNYDQISLPAVGEWTRGIRKIKYIGDEQVVLNQIPIYFDRLKLTELYLPSFTKDISPVSKLANLQILSLGRYENELSPIADLQHLYELELDRFNGDLTSITNLPRLRNLILYRFTNDISAIAEMDLEVLYLNSYNDILRPLLFLKNVRKLQLSSFNGDLSYIGNLKNLEQLFLQSYNGDLSTISKLEKLNTLFLNSFKDGDITPISKLYNLEFLALNRYNGDIDFLRKLRSLKILNLSSYSEDLSALSTMISLEGLSIGVGDNVSLRPLSKLKNLKELLLPLIKDQDLTPLSDLYNLETLNLRRFNGDIRPIANLPNLRKLDLSNYERDIPNLAGLRNLQSLTLLSFTGDNIQGLANLYELRQLYLNLYAGDISPLVNSKKLEELTLPTNNSHWNNWKAYLEELRKK